MASTTATTTPLPAASTGSVWASAPQRNTTSIAKPVVIPPSREATRAQAASTASAVKAPATASPTGPSSADSPPPRATSTKVRTPAQDGCGVFRRRSRSMPTSKPMPRATARPWTACVPIMVSVSRIGGWPQQAASVVPAGSRKKDPRHQRSQDHGGQHMHDMRRADTVQHVVHRAEPAQWHRSELRQDRHPGVECLGGRIVLAWMSQVAAVAWTSRCRWPGASPRASHADAGQASTTRPWSHRPALYAGRSSARRAGWRCAPGPG